MSITPSCDCGWIGKDVPNRETATRRLRQHQDGNRCRLNADDTPCRLCGYEPARRHGLCRGCRTAQNDGESPLDIGGRWVLHRGTRKWVAA